ncbi:MAG: 1-acyl-sn-glycerol-3-phosphate acyltransferase [Rhizobiaceae bacterium]|nr:1-acyl-sn-glycerol-3-phosphate acyltransferase [Rhizobiaceae bacterium]
MFGWLRVAFMLLLVAIVTPPMALAQLLILKTGIGNDRYLPRQWHRFVLFVLGFRLHVRGQMSDKRPLLIAANHISWTDIMVAGAVAEVNFVAKSEVSGWPMIGTLAHLQRTVFVEREQKRKSGDQAGEIAQRMNDGDPMLLFAEGMTSDGNLLLPFKSTLFGAASMAVDRGEADHVFVQPMAIAYTRFHGMPMGRLHRTHAAWIGDRLLAPHIVQLLKEGAVDVEVHFGEAVEYRPGMKRKDLAQAVERRVTEMFNDAISWPIKSREK